MPSAGVVAHAPSKDFLPADNGIIKDFPILKADFSEPDKIVWSSPVEWCICPF